MKRGITLVELLIAIIIASIILGAMLSLYLYLDKMFRDLKPLSDVLEEMRGSVATLDFVFSRWGVGVPCKNNNCILSSPPEDCTEFPPQDPMCITVADNSAEFYANLYGIGFVLGISDGTANALSCRLNDSNSQNCYYVWKGDKLLSVDADGNPIALSINNLSQNNADCLGEPSSPNVTMGSQMENAGISLELKEGYVITRAPHRVRIYVSDGWLMMDKTDMADSCGENENAIKIGKVNSFSIEKVNKGVKVDVTFVSQSQPSKSLRIIRYFGR